MIQPGREALPEAFFLPSGGAAHGEGQRFCLFHAPQGNTLRGRVLYLHPFAEELNTTRRVVAQQARAMARAGYAVLQIDLLGCGDSSGDFSEATWSDWLNDAQLALGWLNSKSDGPLWLWGLRSGTLLATALLSRLSQPANLLLWQPVVSGPQVLQQFLRLHAASQWLGSQKADGPTPAQRLAQGQTVDVAGYTIGPELAGGLADARLQPFDGGTAGRIVWLELSTQSDVALSPAGQSELRRWRAAHWEVDARSVAGPAFWQTVSADEAPNLISTTLAAMVDQHASQLRVAS